MSIIPYFTDLSIAKCKKIKKVFSLKRIYRSFYLLLFKKDMQVFLSLFPIRGCNQFPISFHFQSEVAISFQSEVAISFQSEVAISFQSEVAISFQSELQ
jgi:hypothetical protein